MGSISPMNTRAPAAFMAAQDPLPTSPYPATNTALPANQSYHVRHTCNLLTQGTATVNKDPGTDCRWAVKGARGVNKSEAYVPLTMSQYRASMCMMLKLSYNIVLARIHRCSKLQWDLKVLPASMTSVARMMPSGNECLHP